jgi:hypothetical protein
MESECNIQIEFKKNTHNQEVQVNIQELEPT